MKKITSEMKIIKNETKSFKGVSVPRYQSTQQHMRLTATEKDMLKDLITEDRTERCLVAYFITVLSHKSEDIKTIAAKWDIKGSWANTAFEIGKKLWFKNARRVKYMKRDTPVRLEGAA